MADEYLEIKALGRPCYLGQLYDARTSSLRPGFSLFKARDIQVREGEVTKTDFKLTEVKSISDRAQSLNISAELSVSIMSGAIGANVGGSYLQSKQNTSESVTVALIAQYRTTCKSLDLNSLLSKMDMDPMVLAKTRATHVVTGIVYGGNIVGTLTQKSINKEGNANGKSKGKGNLSEEFLPAMEKSFLSTKFLQDLEKLLSAEANGELSVEEKEKFNRFDLDIDLSADFSLKEETVPTDPFSLIKIIKKSAKLVGDGVPCEISLTPLSILADGIPNFRELAKADLEDIMNAYDHILKLENSRTWLRDAVEAHRELFPTFATAISNRALKVKTLAQNARDKLRHYLQRYRSESTSVKSPSAFVDSVMKEFAIVQTEYDKDKEEWKGYRDRLAVAEQHGFPVIDIGAIGSKMNRANKGKLVVVVVPENANRLKLMNLYGRVATGIYQWRASIDKDKDDNSKTEFISIYADPLHDETLESFDDEAGTLKSALASARETKHGIFLTYGHAQGHIGGLEWNVFNKEGWGVIVNREEAWRYVGDIHLSKPHGSGVMDYTNQTKYTGEFVDGRRDGFGEIIDKEGNVVSSGVFIKNILAPQGIIVEVTVINKDGIPIQYRNVALNKSDSVRVQVDRIGMVMGWRHNQRFRLIPEGGAKVDVIGSMIDPKESSKVEVSFWKLDGTPKLTVYIR